MSIVIGNYQNSIGNLAMIRQEPGYKQIHLVILNVDGCIIKNAWYSDFKKAYKAMKRTSDEKYELI